MSIIVGYMDVVTAHIFKSKLRKFRNYSMVKLEKGVHSLVEIGEDE